MGQLVAVIRNAAARSSAFGLRLLCAGLGLSIADGLAAQDAFEEAGGRFAAPSSHAVGQFPYAAWLGQLDADPTLELVVGNENSDEIAVLQGDGAGGFGAASFLAAGDGAQGVVAGDVDGDADNDVLVANLFANSVTLRRNLGNGTFGPAESIAVGPNPHTLVMADLDGDGDRDLATADGGFGVTVRRNAGDGTFAPGMAFAAGANPRDLVVGDFDRDGDLDLAVTAEGGAAVAVLRNQGSATFGAPVLFPVGAQPQSLLGADLDADGDLDLVVTAAGASEVSVLLGDGAGGFTAGTPIPTLAGASGATLADVDVDGREDLVVTAGFDRVLVHRRGAGASFASGTPYAAGLSARSPLAADLDGDGRRDLVVVTSQSNAVAVLRNLSQPPLSLSPFAGAHASTSYARRASAIWVDRQAAGGAPGSFFSHAGYADVDRDGDMDWLRTFSNNADAFPVAVMRNDGGAFSDAAASLVIGALAPLFVPRKVISGDYNGDGWPDFFVAAHGIDTPPFPGELPRLLLSDGAGRLAFAQRDVLQIGFNHCAASADIDGNGTQDILVGRTNAPYLLINAGGAEFVENVTRLPAGLTLFTCEFADVDGDGFVDLVTGGHEQDGMQTRIHWGRANGLYRTSASFPVPPVPDMGVALDFAFEDIDRDGRRDLVVLRTGSTAFYQGRYIQVLRQTAARVFVDQTDTRMAMNRSLQMFDFLRAQDFDADGDVDLFADDRNTTTTGEFAWRNDGQGVFSPYAGPVQPVIDAVFSSGFE
jgi:hypothetical protein